MMKYVLGLFSCFLLLCWHQTALGQTDEQVRPPGYYTLGLNAGWSYQSSDVPSDLGGFGLGLTLARNVYYQAGAWLCLDMRGRFLYAQQRGLDGRPFFELTENDRLNGREQLDYLNYPSDLQVERGFVFFNHRTDIAELALEAVITLNRLRERSRWIVSLFGGVGLDWQLVRYDQADSTGQAYYADYARLQEVSSRSSIRQELRNTILDGDYETLAAAFPERSGRIDLMPSVGIEVGYELSPRFSIFLGHRVTFSGHDDLDGLSSGMRKDLYHYTQLGMRWILAPASTSTSPIAQPSIRLITPAESPFTTGQSNMPIRAEIRNIRSSAEVSYLVNGRPANFTYGRGSFVATPLLQPGTNEMVIRAQNTAGQAEQRFTVIYQQVENRREPRIQITTPARNPSTTTDNRARLIARIEHVARRDNLTLSVNGRRTEQFDYRNGRLEATVPLRDGENIIRLQAVSVDGQAADEVTIIRQGAVVQPGRSPLVRIVSPERNIRVSRAAFELQARVEHVANRREINLQVNSREITDFRYDPVRGLLRADLSLRAGSNRIRLAAANAYGRQADERTIEYRPLPAAPQVTIDRPAPNSTVQQGQVSLLARTARVTTQRQISIFVNNQNVREFSFNSQRQEVNARLNLSPGENQIRIVVSNEGGQDEDRTRVTFAKPRPPAKPSVEITQPADESITTNDRVSIRARLNNVSQNDQLELSLNGQRIPRVILRGDDLSSRISGLRPGRNTIRLQANTSGGQAEDQITVIYQTASPPTVVIESASEPTLNPLNPNVARSTLIARVRQVNRKDQIRVTHNGSAVTNFDFDAGSGRVQMTINLQKGDNLIRIIATNEGGRAEAEQNIRF